MRKIVVASLMIVASVALVAPLAQATTIETVSSSGTVAVSLPGLQTNTGTRFSGSVTLRRVDFSSGTVTIQPALSPTFAATKEGRATLATLDSIELDGSETSISSLTYNGWIFVPATSGPATVTVTASGSAFGSATSLAAGGAFSSNSISVSGVSLGSGFSANYLDLTGGSASTARVSAVSGDTGCVANVALASVTNVATQVEQTSADSSFNFSSVDAANGLISFSTAGSISSTTSGGGGGGEEPTPLEPTQAFVPPMGGPFTGLGLLLLGLSGAYASVWRPRHQLELVPSTA